MTTIILKLEPEKLENPDLDLRYLIPDLLRDRSNGLIQDDGYDYGTESDTLYLFLLTENADVAEKTVLEFIQNERVLGNDLRNGVTAAMAKDAESTDYRVFFPDNFQGQFNLK